MPDANDEIRVLTITEPLNVERIRREARELAAGIGFDRAGAESVALAVSELATNLLRYAPGGQVTVTAFSGDAGTGISIASRDGGPGIADVDLALQDGYSTGGGMGSGLPAIRRLMDDFALTSGPEGTYIEARKWLTSPSR